MLKLDSTCRLAVNSNAGEFLILNSNPEPILPLNERFVPLHFSFIERFVTACRHSVILPLWYLLTLKNTVMKRIANHFTLIIAFLVFTVALQRKMQDLLFLQNKKQLK